MKKAILGAILPFVMFFSCKERNLEERTYNVRSDIRFGSRFFSILIHEDGTAYAIKGSSTYYTEPLKVLTSDTSNTFKLDSVRVFFEKLNGIRDSPMIGVKHLDAPRVEIYYNQKKIYDTYRWDAFFWDLFRP